MTMLLFFALPLPVNLRESNKKIDELSSKEILKNLYRFQITLFFCHTKAYKQQTKMPKI